jgi:hypothetical protein
MYKTYVINVPPSADLSQLQYYVQVDPRILSYWNYLPYLFCVKTEMTAKEIAEAFSDVSDSMFVAEINPQNVYGRLPKAAWEWFKAPVGSRKSLPDQPSAMG